MSCMLVHMTASNVRHCDNSSVTECCICSMLPTDLGEIGIRSRTPIAITVLSKLRKIGKYNEINGTC